MFIILITTIQFWECHFSLIWSTSRRLHLHGGCCKLIYSTNTATIFCDNKPREKIQDNSQNFQHTKNKCLSYCKRIIVSILVHQNRHIVDKINWILVRCRGLNKYKDWRQLQWTDCKWKFDWQRHHECEQVVTSHNYSSRFYI